MVQENCYTKNLYLLDDIASIPKDLIRLQAPMNRQLIDVQKWFYTHHSADKEFFQNKFKEIMVIKMLFHEKNSALRSIVEATDKNWYKSRTGKASRNIQSEVAHHAVSMFTHQENSKHSKVAFKINNRWKDSTSLQ